MPMNISSYFRLLPRKAHEVGRSPVQGVPPNM
jgi:hypothetical protein